MSSKDKALLHSLYQMIEKDEQDQRLVELLKETVKDYSLENGVLNLTFLNEITVKIISDLNSYKLEIVPNTFYFNDETINSNMGIDRVCFYLKQMAEYRYA